MSDVGGAFDTQGRLVSANELHVFGETIQALLRSTVSLSVFRSGSGDQVPENMHPHRTQRSVAGTPRWTILGFQ